MLKDWFEGTKTHTKTHTKTPTNVFNVSSKFQ